MTILSSLSILFTLYSRVLGDGKPKSIISDGQMTQIHDINAQVADSDDNHAMHFTERINAGSET
jgi:hypothetical protein